MRRYLLDTGIAGCYIDRQRGVFERARSEVSLGNWIGIAHPVLAELAYRVEGSPNRDRNRQRLQLALASWKLWPVTEESTFEYGRIAAELRRFFKAGLQDWLRTRPRRSTKEASLAIAGGWRDDPDVEPM